MIDGDVASDANTGEATIDSPVRLTDCVNPYEASALVAMLDEAGIMATVDGDLVGFNYVEAINYPIVRVASNDLERAVELVRDWRADIKRKRAERKTHEELGKHWEDEHSESAAERSDNSVYRFLWRSDGRPGEIGMTLVKLLLYGTLFGMVSKLLFLLLPRW